ncbi:MAG: FAD-dependent oxidoreductase [Candidatus Pacebacteria bacterium]|nr:FAD-dependent oxidoreductase [Candidatus Paceibacterota bacterium]
MYDLIIIGGGPGGVAAAVYAARKKLHTLIIAKEFGGQSNVSENIENWIGTPNISGMKLAEDLRAHAYAYNGKSLTIIEGDIVKHIERKGSDFAVTAGSPETGNDTAEGNADGNVTYSAKTILVTSGSYRRKLEAKGADIFENKGITYCASCDGPIFADQDVVVIGGGNAAFETAAQLLAYCKSVTLLHRSAQFRADEVTVEKVLANPKMKSFTNVEIEEVKGDKFVSGIVFKNKIDGTVTELPVTGIFVEIGQLPNTGYVKDLLPLNEANQVIVDPKTQRAGVPGAWAAGDCTDGLYHQNNIAVGDAVKAIEDLYIYLHKR